MFSSASWQFDVNGKYLSNRNINRFNYLYILTQDSTGVLLWILCLWILLLILHAIISYARIEYAYYGLRCVNASPTLSNSYLWKCRRGANLSVHSSPTY